MLYQLSHFRSMTRPPCGGAESQDRTGDTAIFSRVLYQLSYLGPMANQARSPVGGAEDTTGLRRASTSADRQARSPGRVSGRMVRPAAESSMSVASRFARVSGRFALTIQ